MNENNKKIIARNKKAKHDYHLMKTYEAGVVLAGTEVKSLRAGRCQLRDSWCEFRNGELWMNGVHISPYEQGNINNKDPLRSRKLLMHKDELRRLQSQVAEKGLTLVPYSLYFLNSKVKVEIALAKGKKDYDKRQDLKNKAAERAMRSAESARW